MKKRLLIIATFVMVLAISGLTTAYFTTEGTARNVVTTGGIDIELNEFADTGNGLVDFKDMEGVMPDTDASKIVVAENVGKHSAYVRMHVDMKSSNGDPSEVCSLDFNTKDWTYKDGFYYYNKPLEPKESSEPLFTTVNFGKNMDNSWQNAKILIDVTVYGVQSENNGSSALDAAGWPKKGGK